MTPEQRGSLLGLILAPLEMKGDIFRQLKKDEQKPPTLREIYVNDLDPLEQAPDRVHHLGDRGPLP